ncbi:hypothetical protein Aperf_G00000122729 [Anoplocephala perfoliata]
MLPFTESYLIPQFFTKDTKSAADPPQEPSENANLNDNEDFIGSLKEIISFASESSSKFAKELKSTAKHISDKIVSSAPFIEFNRAHAEFVAERKRIPKSDASSSLDLLYSSGDNKITTDADSQLCQQRIKEEVLRLSADEQNFLRPPPRTSCFQWCPRLAELHMPLATALLKEDENLASMRFCLVPRRLKEDDFWRNYFYRVSLIRQSENLPGAIPFPDSTAEQPESQASASEPSDNSKPEGPKDGNCQQKQSSTMSSPAVLSLSSDSVDEIEAELMLEDSEIDNTVVIDEDLEHEILEELSRLEVP